jgi:predicted HicB family RNase H-like nuclease
MKKSGSERLAEEHRRLLWLSLHERSHTAVKVAAAQAGQPMYKWVECAIQEKLERERQS